MGTSPSVRRSRDALVGGLVLVTVGAILLVGQLVPDLSRYVALIIGLGLLALFLVRQEYGLLIAGCIVTGVGVGIVIASTASGDLAGAGFLLSLGSGFLAIWLLSYLLRLSERHPWPLVPGLILTSIGAALAVGGSAMDLLSLWPVALIVVGLVLVASWMLAARREA